MPVDWSSLTAADSIQGDDAAETAQLQEMLSRAEKFLRSHRWCPTILERFLGFGVGGIVAVFLFRLEAKVGGPDELLWVVEGDLPSAYVVTDCAPTAADALEIYCDLMDDWVNAVRLGLPLTGVFPVAAKATTENANLLATRIEILRESFVSLAREAQERQD